MTDIQISLLYCDDDQYCHRLQLSVPINTTIEQALALSQWREQLALPEPLIVGIFGLKMPLDTVLADGERIEIYRPLRMNPKEIRRKRAEKYPVGRFQRGNQFRKQQIRANQVKQRNHIEA